MAKILIEVVEREISTRMLPNNSIEKKVLENEICNIMEKNWYNKKEFLQHAYENTRQDFGININELSAWINANCCNKNYDWKIFDLSKSCALISIVDRVITITQFDSLEEAQATMKKEFEKCSNWENWKKDFTSDVENSEYAFYKYSAWANDDKNYNWFIVNHTWFL